ncbi:hypothetical protein Hanom_Chr04g00305461 [Helianthus anomalus]
MGVNLLSALAAVLNVQLSAPPCSFLVCFQLAISLSRLMVSTMHWFYPWSVGSTGWRF